MTRYVSSGTSSPMQLATFRESNRFAPRGSGQFACGPARDHAFCGESAAFLIESMIREIITGRYLTPYVSCVYKGTQVKCENIHDKAAVKKKKV